VELEREGGTAIKRERERGMRKGIKEGCTRDVRKGGE
jgi:hypothetical protein